MSDLQLLALTGELLYTFNFAAECADPLTVSSIDYVVPSQLTQFADSDDLVNKKGTIGLRVSASGLHGQTCVVEAKATLSNTEKVTKYLTVRIFRG